MAEGKLRTTPHAKQKTAQSAADVAVQVDDSDLDMLESGTLRVVRVTARQKLDATPGAYHELEVDGDSLPIVDVAVDPKRGMSAIVTVR